MPLRQSYKDDSDIRAGERTTCIKEPVSLSAMDAACIIQFLQNRVNNTDWKWMLDVLTNGSSEFRTI